MSSSGLGLNGALAMGAQSLSNQQLGVDVAGRNISNANTDGATKQRLNLATDTALTQNRYQVGTGSTVSNIQSLRNSILDAAIVRESTGGSYYSTLSSQTTLAESALGESLSSSDTTKTSGIQQQLTDFFDAWQSLSSSPTDTTIRQEVVSKAQILTAGLNGASTNLLKQQSDVAVDAGDSAANANDLAAQLASLNKQISRSEALSGSGTANDLRDQRQATLESLAKLADITVTTESNGMIDVALTADTSQVLVSGVTAGATATTVTLGSAYDASTSPALTLTVTSSSGTSTLPDATASAVGGQIGADVYVANTLIGSPDSVGNTGMLGNLDQVAINLANKVNTLQGGGYDNYGNLSTYSIFGTTTGAGDIAVTTQVADDPNYIAASSSASSKLDGSNATSIANLRSDTTIVPAYQTLVTAVGQEVSQASSNEASQKVLYDAIKAQRSSVSGISLDEETVSLMSYQKAYEASAKFITTIDDMLSTILAMKT